MGGNAPSLPTDTLVLSSPPCQPHGQASFSGPIQNSQTHPKPQEREKKARVRASQHKFVSPGLIQGLDHADNALLLQTADIMHAALRCIRSARALFPQSHGATIGHNLITLIPALMVQSGGPVMMRSLIMGPDRCMIRFLLRVGGHRPPLCV